MDAVTEPQTVEETGGADGREVSQAPAEPQNGDAEVTADAAPEAPTEAEPPAEEASDAAVAPTEAEPPAEPAPEAAEETPAADADGNGQEQAADTPATNDTQVAAASEEAAVDAIDSGTAEAAADEYEEDFSEMSENAAERAGAVVPVPISTSDSRSREKGGDHGEDRSEVRRDGGDNSRGAGNWKSEEEAYMKSSLAKQHAEQEALQAVIDEKSKLQHEYDEMQVRYLPLEEGSKKWEEENSMLKERCQKLETRIKELEAREAQLVEFEAWGKDNEAKVKDLQGRLGILAGEDAEKDRRIQKLEEDLRDINSRLINAELQAAIGAESMHRPTPKSKTCIIM